MSRIVLIFTMKNPAFSGGVLVRMRRLFKLNRHFFVIKKSEALVQQLQTLVAFWHLVRQFARYFSTLGERTTVELAVRETIEESGIEVAPDDLQHLGVVRADYVQGDYLSNAMRGLFAYRFDGTAEDLKVEEGDGAGFETFDIDELERQLVSNPDKFAVVLADNVGKTLVREVKSLLDS